MLIGCGCLTVAVLFILLLALYQLLGTSDPPRYAPREGQDGAVG
jgi:hypothetical protein